jgi:dihydroorotase
MQNSLSIRVKDREEHLESILNELSYKYEQLCMEHVQCKQELLSIKTENDNLRSRIMDSQLCSGSALNKVT